MSADIDLDFANRETVLQLIQATPARQLHQGQVRRHNSGVYVTDIPYDPVNRCAAIDYKTAESRGYFKIDLLNMSVYQLVKDPGHYQDMLNQPPDWSRLWTDSTSRMAAFISIIRPGKAHLQNCSWQEVFESVWDGDDSCGFVFKRSHAISYSALVALHMNILSEK
jgi:hypothetical protein